MKTVSMGGIEVPCIGQGTWHMGERRGSRKAEVEALQLGFDLGMTLVDTAEMYADGGAEEVVGDAIRGRRDEVFVVSKVLPYNASRRGTIRAAESSLRRMQIETMDLYLLHWEGPHPLQETLSAFEQLRDAGKIRRFGVSNFDLPLMEDCWRETLGAEVCCNQVLYNLTRRGIEWGLLEECTRRAVTIMAYSPLEQGRIGKSRALQDVADRHAAPPAQVALAFSVHRPGVMAIPKATSQTHVRDNAAAARITLSEQDIQDLSLDFPPPHEDTPLETL